MSCQFLKYIIMPTILIGFFALCLDYMNVNALLDRRLCPTHLLLKQLNLTLISSRTVTFLAHPTSGIPFNFLDSLIFTIVSFLKPPHSLCSHSLSQSRSVSIIALDETMKKYGFQLGVRVFVLYC